MANKLKIGQPTSGEALRILRSLPFLDILEDEDAQLEAEYRARIDGAEAALAVAAPGHSKILVSTHITGPARQGIEQSGLSAADATGYAHIDVPGIFIHVAPPLSPRKRVEPRLHGRAGAVAETLLLEPERKWTISELVKRSSTSLGTAHRVVDYLEERKLVDSEGKGRHKRRRLQMPGALLDLVAEDQPERAVTQLRTFFLEERSGQLMKEVQGALKDHQIGFAFSGAAAAYLLAPHLTASPAVLMWVESAQPLSSVAGIINAEQVSRGFNLMLSQVSTDAPLFFVRENDGIALASDIRIYLDALKDPKRGEEQAKHFRATVIGF